MFCHFQSHSSWLPAQVSPAFAGYMHLFDHCWLLLVECQFSLSLVPIHVLAHCPRVYIYIYLYIDSFFFGAPNITISVIPS